VRIAGHIPHDKGDWPLEDLGRERVCSVGWIKGVEHKERGLFHFPDWSRENAIKSLEAGARGSFCWGVDEFWEDVLME